MSAADLTLDFGDDPEPPAEPSAAAPPDPRGKVCTCVGCSLCKKHPYACGCPGDSAGVEHEAVLRLLRDLVTVEPDGRWGDGLREAIGRIERWEHRS